MLYIEHYLLFNASSLNASTWFNPVQVITLLTVHGHTRASIIRFYSISNFVSLVGTSALANLSEDGTRAHTR